MQRQNAVIDFTRYGENEILPKGRVIHEEMTINAALYNNPPVPLPVVKGHLDAYELILNKPIYDTRTADLRAARLLVNSDLHDNGVYVNTIAIGDLVKLGKSGYPLTDLHSPVGDLDAPESVEFRNGESPLTFEFDIAKVDKADGYLIAFTPITNTDPDPNNWSTRYSKKHTRTVGTTLVHGTEYKAAACAVGSSNNLFWRNASKTVIAQ